MREKYDVWRGRECREEVGKVKRYSIGVYQSCGMRRVDGQRRKWSEWWNGGVCRAGAEKRRAFEECLQRRDRVTYDRYRAQRVAVKLAVQSAKRMADWRWGERLGNDFEGNKKMFWEEVKRVRKGEQASEEMVMMLMAKYCAMA